MSGSIPISLDGRQDLLEFPQFLVPLDQQEDLLQPSQCFPMAGIVHEPFFMCTPNSVYIPTNSLENALCLITVDCFLVKPGIGYDLLGVLAVEFAVVCFSFFTHFEQFVDVPAESIP